MELLTLGIDRSQEGQRSRQSDTFLDKHCNDLLTGVRGKGVTGN